MIIGWLSGPKFTPILSGPKFTPIVLFMAAVFRRGKRGDPSPAVSGLAGDTYRPALDGVRAVAVVAVILYHVDWLPGGYLGVDTFFVLSGYLITLLLLAEFDRSGRVRLLNFWSRRARRLYPAVLLLVAVCLVELYGIQSEQATLHTRRGDIVSTLFYYANWHFIATDQSYFASFLSGVSPLRHMWSLAIEEQFYLAWPILLVLLLTLSRRRPVVVLGVIGVGVIASIAALAIEYRPGDSSRAYFGTDGRAHVLLIGAALAFLTSRRLGPNGSASVLRGLGVVAIVCVVAAFVALDDTQSLYYRGGAALFALCVAVVLLVVEAQPAGGVARALSMGPLTWTGRISYSLYLWHWPIIIWTTSFIALTSATAQKLLAIALTFVAASASYYLVEAPVRFGRVPWLRLSRRRLALVLSSAVIVVLAATWKVTAPTFANNSSVPCPPGSPNVGSYRWCIRVDPTVKDPLVMVAVGDSTVRALDPGLADVAVRRARRYIDAGQDGCSLLPVVIANSDQHCESELGLVRDIEARQHPKLWIVSDLFSLNPVRAPDGTVVRLDQKVAHDALISRATRTMVAELTRHGGKVILVPTPPSGAPANCGDRVTGATCGGKSHSIHDEAHLRLAVIYRQIAASMPGRVAAVSIADLLCTRNGQCPAYVDGELARIDGVHYTASFSRKLVPIILRRAHDLGVTT
jgi:peptidoglycan/LPS O-acetylase OafA/YrhL